MSGYPKQLVIDDPLWSFMLFCEVRCGRDCCGTGAFEVHEGLLLRKTIDMNLAGGNGEGSEAFRKARKQIKELVKLTGSCKFETVHAEVPLWSSALPGGPEFWIRENEIAGWLSQWEASFNEASKVGGLDKEPAPA